MSFIKLGMYTCISTYLCKKAMNLGTTLLNVKWQVRIITFCENPPMNNNLYHYKSASFAIWQCKNAPSLALIIQMLKT